VFVGRTNELHILEEGLIAGKHRTALIVGPYGIGKSSLAQMFAKAWSHFFTAGIHRTEAGFLNYDSISIFEEWRLADPLIGPNLIIIENLDGQDSRMLRDALSRIRQNNPETRVIATSRANVPGYDVLIRLTSLSEAEMQALSEQHNVALGQNGYELLFQLTNGHPLAGTVLSSLIRNDHTSIDELVRFLAPFSSPGLVDPDGLPIRRESPEEQEVISSVIAVNVQILESISRDPHVMYALSPRKFEELIAALFSREGYDVTLTPASRDGGIDVYVARKDALASLMFLVQCKRHAMDNPIQVRVIRELYGVVEQHRATGGIIATTSTFTKGAKEFTDSFKHRLSLRDYVALH